MEALLNGPFGATQLGPDITMLGRTPDNQVVVNDNKASSRHAEIRLQGQEYSITDLGSTNGTFVNERQLSPNMPRPLRPSDRVRIGDTTYTFEIRNTQPPVPGMYSNQGPSSNPNFAPTQIAQPQYPGTAYGGSPSAPNYPPMQQGTNYQQYPGQQPHGFPPPPQGGSAFNQYNQPTQEASYTPPPPPYNAGQPYNPTPMPGPGAYAAPGGGMPPYPTPVPGAYAAPGGSIPPYVPQAPLPRRGGGLRTIILAALALIVIIGAATTFFVVHNNQVATDNMHATATAQTAKVHSTATGVAITQATGTAVVNATATANTQSGDGAYATGKVVLQDALKDNSGGNKWQENSNCSFSQGIYELKETSQNTFATCFATNTNFNNFSYRVALRILSGDCAGAAFRGDSTSNKQYYFEICQTGTYALVVYDGSSSNGKYLIKPTASSAIKTGTGSDAINVIAVTADNDTMTLYANTTMLSSVQDATLTSGSIGVVGINDKSSGTDVGFADAKVWSI